MKRPVLQIDERNASRTQKICTRLYLFTIAALWFDVFWRQIILNQSMAEPKKSALPISIVPKEARTGGNKP